MTIKIELRPEEEQALFERARLSGRDLPGHVQQVLLRHLRIPELGSGKEAAGNVAKPTFEDLIDYEAISSREREADDSITLEEVRAATSKISDSMARVVIEEERAGPF
jgi:hypothetical protein